MGRGGGNALQERCQGESGEPNSEEETDLPGQLDKDGNQFQCGMP